jgi:molybdenum cofactor synthesis domain-containing protein
VRSGAYQLRTPGAADRRPDRIRPVRSADSHAIILTVGDELTSGDVENTNGSWLAQRLAELGMRVRMLVAVPDDVDEIAELISDQRRRAELVFVTGGLGGTPDDVTREGVARAFGVGVERHPGALAVLRERFPGGVHGYVERFAMLPVGAQPLTNPLGGAPGFVIGNVVVLAGVPAEMRATYGAAEATLRERHGAPPIRSVRLCYETTEAEIVAVLELAGERHPAVAVGSYPRFENGSKRVEIVLKSDDDDALGTAAAWIAGAVDEVLAGT